MKRSALLAGLFLIPACGGGDDDGPSATIAVSTSGTGGVVTVDYALAGSGTWDVEIDWSADGGATWTGAAPANGCPTPKARAAPGAYTFLWDTIADAASGAVLVRGRTSGSSSTSPATIAHPGLVFLDRTATADASTSPLTFPPAHRGHYDLSPSRLSFLDDPGFAPLVAQVPVKSWRISVGRWEIGPVWLMAPEAASYSLVPAELATSSREFYRGPDSIAGAQNPANYHFGYLDAALAAVEACGAEPYLCFDYMPFTLALNQNPLIDNIHLSDPNFSFSNGIRTSPPATPEVYAEVVKQVVLHVKASRPLTYVEIGNEPDLLNGALAPTKYFWTGTRAQFIAMYRACAAALDAQFGATIKIGAASFGWQTFEPAPTFADDFLQGLAGARLDFLSYHVYDDDPAVFASRAAAAKALRDLRAPGAALHCPEWGMNLDGGPEFDDMTAALHHARALEYFLLFDVELSHRALVRDIVAAPGGLGLLASPARNKPAAYVFQAYERLASTPQALPLAALPVDKPMILAGKNADEATVLFFHEAPPPGQVGRFALNVTNLPFASWTAERRVLTDAGVSSGDGLRLASVRDGSGAFAETILFTDDTLIAWRLTRR